MRNAVTRRFTSALACFAAFGAAACGSDDKTNSEPPPQPPHVLVKGEIGTWLGDGTQGHDGDGHDRLESWLNQPMEVAFAEDGSALVVDWNNHCVRRVTTDGTLENVIGTPMPGDWPCQVPPGGMTPAEQVSCEVPLSGTMAGDELSLNHPMDVAFESDGSFFLGAWHNHKIEHYDLATKNVTIVAGVQNPGPADGDGSLASAAHLNFPGSIVLQPDGSLLLSDQRNNRVRRIAKDTGIISTVAGSTPAPMGTGVDGTDIPATTALLSLTTGDKAAGADNPPPGGAIALDDAGNLYIADTYHHCVRRVAPGADGIVNGADVAEETISVVAGTCGTAGYSGDDGPAASALLSHPFDLELGPDGALYVADTANHAVRRVDLTAGTIETIAGSGKPGYAGDDGPAKDAVLREPYGLAFDSAGDLFVVDTQNNRIRRIVM